MDHCKIIHKKEHNSLLKDPEAGLKEDGNYYVSTKCGIIKPCEEVDYFWKNVNCELCLNERDNNYLKVRF